MNWERWGRIVGHALMFIGALWALRGEYDRATFDVLLGAVIWFANNTTPARPKEGE